MSWADIAPYWQGLKDGKLMLCRCDDTLKWIHPLLERSRYTGGPVHFEEASGKGTVSATSWSDKPWFPAGPRRMSSV